MLSLKVLKNSYKNSILSAMDTVHWISTLKIKILLVLLSYQTISKDH